MLQVLKFEFQKFRIFEILNLHQVVSPTAKLKGRLKDQKRKTTIIDHS